MGSLYTVLLSHGMPSQIQASDTNKIHVLQGCVAAVNMLKGKGVMPHKDKPQDELKGAQ